MDPARSDPEAGSVTIATDECWRLLAGTRDGHVGLVVGGEPEIYPVNHVVDRGAIAFRVGPGPALAGLAAGPRVSFEAEGADAAERHTGWRVLAEGVAEVHYEPDLYRHPATPPVDTWPDDPKSRWVRIVPTDITGRRSHDTGPTPVASSGAV